MLRAFFAVLIGFTVAVAPATSGSPIVPPVHAPEASEQADIPCPVPDACKDSIACIVKCFNFVAVETAAPEPIGYISRAVPFLTSEPALHEHVPAPPTHPPTELPAI